MRKQVVAIAVGVIIFKHALVDEERATGVDSDGTARAIVRSCLPV